VTVAAASGVDVPTAARLAPFLVVALCGCSADPTAGFSQTAEVYRKEVGFDAMFCMRVQASPAEVERFVNDRFATRDRVAVHPEDGPLTCPATFWPLSFSNPTLAYRSVRQGDWVSSTRGVIFEDGYLYYWNLAL
jgi:hypothetical protein